ncbi:MAG: hypothetical protein EOO13_06505 [Chitinophagaceae bacterium]|nr:MAG: hypothetical protein EOO13_06505 [Chitinophagaceae bacterium]
MQSLLLQHHFYEPGNLKPRPMRRSFFLFAFFTCTITTQAQRKIRFNTEALSVVVAEGNEFAAVTTADSLFVYRLPELSLYKKSKHNLVYPVILSFAASSFANSDMNDVLVIQENHFTPSPAAYNIGIVADLERYKSSAYGEKPHDSISLWSISKATTLNKISGNYYFDFFTFREMGVFAMNYISNAFAGADGDSVFVSKKAAIMSQWNTDKSQESEINGVIKKLITCPVNLSFAFIAQDPISKKYKVYIKKTETHRTLFESKELDQRPGVLEYSSNGKKLLYATGASYKKSLIEVVDVNGGKITASIPVEDELTNAAFTNFDSAVSYATPSNWVRWNLQDARIEKQISGTAFFSGFKLFDAIPTDDYLFVHTQAMSPTGMALPQSEIQLSPLGDFAVFANVEKGGAETVSLFDGYNMQLNDLPQFFLDLRFNPAKTHFTINGNNNKRLQVWETKSRKKILDKYFANRVDGFVDASGRFVWIIEYKDGDASRYRLRHIDLKTGKMVSSDQLVASEGKFKNNDNLVDALAIPNEPNSWYVSDGDQVIWKFKGDNTTPEKYEFSVPGFVNMRSIASDGNGNIYANIYNSNKERTIISIDFPKRSFKKIAEGDFSSPVPYKGGMLFESGNDIVFFKDGKIQHTIKVEGKLIRVAVDAKNDRLFVQIIKEDGTDLLRIIDSSGTQRDQLLPERVMGMEVLNNGQLVYISEAIKTFVDEKTDPIQWDASLPKNVSADEASVSPNGRYILKNHLIVDLKEANRYPTDPFSKTLFIKGKHEMERIELFSKGWNTDQYFTLRRISGLDTLVSESKVKIPDGETVGYAHNSIALSPDGRWAVTYADIAENDAKRARPMIWDVSSLKGYLFPAGYGEQVPFFSSDTGKVFIQSEMKYDETTMAASFSMNEFKIDDKGLSFTKQLKKQSALALSGEYNFELPEFTAINWYEPGSNKVKKSFYSSLSMHSFTFSKEHLMLFGGTADGVLNVWDINGASSPTQSLRVTNDQVKDIKVVGDKVFVFSVTSNVALYSIKEKKLLGNIQYLQKNDDQKLAMYTPDRFFNIDPEAVEALHFVKQGEIFPLSSYELQGNRPDKLYKAFGLADDRYIEALNKGWQTRLKRVGVKPGDSIMASHGPLLQWNRDNLPMVSGTKTIDLTFTVVDTSNSPVKTLLININGVPLTGRKGISIQSQKNAVQFNKSIELNSGKNSISIIAINNKGEESTEQTHEVYYLPERKQPSKIVYIGIGVSKYKDSSKNLVYAAKDVKDIATRLKYFADTVVTHTLTDAMAGKQQILAIKKILNTTSTDDVVILSFSGHGMIDSANGFLFAPHDMNFNAPALNGLTMTMIEDLLDDIPARKRLLLMDACHSGEQLEGLSANASLPEGVKEINTKGNEKIKRKEDKEKEADRKGYMIMKDLFSDFSRGNGAFMISAAASNEFALESKQWNNGVFTASFIEALYEVKEKSADKKIKVRELRKTIYEKVKLRTKGQQTPTSRQENGWWNWSF